jgi:hypothetical protein
MGQSDGVLTGLPFNCGVGSYFQDALKHVRVSLILGSCLVRYCMALAPIQIKNQCFRR